MTPRQIPLTMTLIEEERQRGGIIVKDDNTPNISLGHRYIRRVVHHLDGHFYYYGPRGRRRFIVRAELLNDNPRTVHFIVKS